MKRLLFMLFVTPLVFASCSDNDDKDATPTLSFAKTALSLTEGSVTLDLTVSDADLSALSTPVTIPVTFSGTAVKGSEYSVSAEQFILGGNNQSLSITVTALDNYDEAKEIIASIGNVAGFAVGSSTATISLGQKSKIVYSFLSKTAVMSAGATVQIDLYNADGSSYKAPNEITIPISVDTEKSTALEGTHFAFTGEKKVVIAQGKSSGSTTLECLAVEEDKDTFVIKADLENNKGFVRGNYNTITISIFGSYFDKIAGTWRVKTFETNREYMEGLWSTMVTGYDLYPVLNTADTFTFDDAGLTTSLQSSLKDFFRPTSNIAKGLEYNLNVGVGDKRALQLIELDNTNRYFSSAQESDDKVSYIGVRVATDDQTKAEMLELYLLDYESKSFFPELLDFGMYNPNKPMATMSGMFLYYTLERVANN